MGERLFRLSLKFVELKYNFRMTASLIEVAFQAFRGAVPTGKQKNPFSGDKPAKVAIKVINGKAKDEVTKKKKKKAPTEGGAKAQKKRKIEEHRRSDGRARR